MDDRTSDDIAEEPKPVTHRIKQLNSLVQHEVSDILRRVMEWPNGTLVTVTQVSVSEDAESARIWLSVLPTDRGEQILDMVKGNIREVQTLLNKKLVMKFVPKLIFVLDSSEERAQSIESVLDRLEHENQ